MLKNDLALLNLSVTDTQLSQFQGYIDLLFKWNKAYNLSAIRDKSLMYPYHLYDSLAIAPFIKKNRIIDIGSGAGLPGIPLAILLPEKKFTLLDSNIKKSRFQRQVLLELDLKNVEIIHDRSEHYQPQEKFDYVTSRAFSSLVQMVTWCKHLLKPDGLFLAMKGQYPKEELKDLAQVINATIETYPLHIPKLEAKRHLISIKPN